ncbi:phytanoyl-CoA dioxygenase family protein [Kitasatospora cineracea]
MAGTRVMNIAIFLDDATDQNDPLLFVSGSHRRGVIDAGEPEGPAGRIPGRST